MSIPNTIDKTKNGFFIGTQSGYHVTVPEFGEFKYDTGVRGNNCRIYCVVTDDDITVYHQKYDEIEKRYRPYNWMFKHFISDKAIKNLKGITMNKNSIKMKNLIASLEEIGENCLDNIDNPEFHKEQLVKAGIALEGYLELKNTIDVLEDQGIEVKEDIAHNLFKITENKLDKDPTMTVTFESFSSNEVSLFNKAISDRINQLGLFVLEKIETLKENFNEDEIIKVCNFSERTLGILKEMKSLLS